ncbi:ABC transporter permease [Kutzneria sp. CA-103260]|uniref:ABC transporter permease n=1 Tax=Kutzneria sp. CA-103260 TaxID=2802641 RepID=UPI001BEE46E8|nr:ABC transporter permease [Kutzneria sp. CA-103260]QUQ65588.1 hypothetical protein JJ691_33120 [Kutzneria sp. CA-103260]
MTRIFRIELRRSVAPWAGLAIAVVALGYLFLMSGPWWKEPAPWYGQTTTTVLWLRSMMMFLWPIVLGLGVIQGMRDGRSGVTELFSTTSRPGWQRAAKLAGAVGLLVALGILVVFLAGAAEVASYGGFFSWSFVPVLVVSVLVVVAGASIGLAVGRLLPHPLTAPALAVVGFVLSLMCWAATENGISSPLGTVVPPRLALLGPAFAEPRSVFTTLTASVDLGQAAWLIGLAATGFLLLAARSVRAKLLGLLPVVAGVAVALPLLPATAADALTTDTVAAQQVCDGPVCVAQVHQAQLATFSAVGKDVLAKLGTLPNAPTRIEESTATMVPDRDPAVVYADIQTHSELATVSADGLRRFLLAGAGTPVCTPYYEVRPPATLARMISAAYFTGDFSLLPGDYWFDLGPDRDLGAAQAMWAKFHALPADVQRTRIIAMRQVFLTCQGNPLDALLPGDGR